MTLNADCPPFESLVRREYLYNQERGHGEFVPCVVFGVSSLHGLALGFHVMTDVGAVIWRLPVSALAAHERAPALPLDVLELWDSPSYELAIHEFGWLQGARVRTILRDRKQYDGRYRFTVDFYGSGESESAGEIGHKCKHLIELDCGAYCAQPNNRILWASPAFVTRPFEQRPDYLTNTHAWRVEGASKWATEDTDRMFYDVTPSNPMDSGGRRTS